MNEGMTLNDVVKGLESVQSTTGLLIMLANAAGELKTSTAGNLQDNILHLISADLDHPKRNGIFSINGSTGTKPCSWGIAISIGRESDVYQIAVSSDGRLFFRANINNYVAAWKEVAVKTT